MVAEQGAQQLLAQMEGLKAKLEKHGYEVNVTPPAPKTSEKSPKALAKKKNAQVEEEDLMDSLRLPMVITAFYILSLQRWAGSMKEEIAGTGAIEIWNSPPVVSLLETENLKATSRSKI